MSLSPSSLQLAVAVASLAGVASVLLGEFSNISAGLVFGAAFALTLVVQNQLGVDKKQESTFAKYEIDDSDFEDEKVAVKKSKKSKKKKKKKGQGPTQKKKKKQEPAFKRKKEKKTPVAAVEEVPTIQTELAKLEAMDETDMSKGKKKRHRAKIEKLREEAIAESEEEVTNGWTKIPMRKKAVTEVDQGALTGEAASKQTAKTISIPQSKHGAIFGSKAVNLMAIQTKTLTQIQMPKRDNKSDSITIEGPAEGVRKAELYLKQLVEKGFCEATHPGQTQAVVDVPPEKLHFVIGVKGAVISVLQEKTDTKINTPDRKSKSSKVTVLGGKTGVRKAKAAIKQLISQGFSPLTHEGWVKEEIDVPENMLRKLIGQKGVTIKNLQNNSGAKILIPEAGSEMKMVIVAGLPNDVATACESINKILDAEGAGAGADKTHPDWSQYDDNHDHHDEDALWD